MCQNSLGDKCKLTITRQRWENAINLSCFKESEVPPDPLPTPKKFSGKILPRPCSFTEMVLFGKGPLAVTVAGGLELIWEAQNW
jgi:hypothetical protein